MYNIFNEIGLHEMKLCNPWNVQASIGVSYNWIVQVNGNGNQLFKSYFHSQSVVQLELLNVAKEKEKM
jgi:hypothetical protein